VLVGTLWFGCQLIILDHHFGISVDSTAFLQQRQLSSSICLRIFDIIILAAIATASDSLRKPLLSGNILVITRDCLLQWLTVVVRCLQCWPDSPKLDQPVTLYVLVQIRLFCKNYKLQRMGYCHDISKHFDTFCMSKRRIPFVGLLR
jgi:hypothetical protein